MEDVEDMANMEDMVVVEDMEEQGQSGSSLLGILLHTIIRRADFILKIHFLIYMNCKQMTNIPLLPFPIFLNI